MMKKNTFLSLILALSFITSAMAQTTYYVQGGVPNGDGSEGSPFSTVNNAVGPAVNGDIIIIVGTITQTGTVNINESLTFTTKEIKSINLYYFFK